MSQETLSGKAFVLGSVRDVATALVLAGFSFVAGLVSESGGTRTVLLGLGFLATAFAAGVAFHAHRAARTFAKLLPAPVVTGNALSLRRVRLGKVLVTEGVRQVAAASEVERVLGLHEEGDWGGVSEEIRGHNIAAAHGGGRLLSVHLSSGGPICAVTERRTTTVCLVSECREFQPAQLPESALDDEREPYRRDPRRRFRAPRKPAVRGRQTGQTKAPNVSPAGRLY